MVLTVSPEIAQLFSLEGRTVIVAGASRGIGEAIANGFAGAGARVVGCGRSAPDVRAEQRRFEYRSCDVTDGAAFEGLCDEVRAIYGRLDAYVFAAGITLPVSAGEQSVEAFEQTLSVNLVAAYRSALNVARCMKDSGSIVFVTSIGSLLGFPGNPGYLASKGGLRQLARGLALDLGSRGIRVNMLAPGYIYTRMTEASYNDPTQHAARASRTMLGRWGKPEELVGAAIFLTSDASAYMTGQDLIVDGGWTAKGL